ncbi:hypothetical protein [Streptomyces sp. DH8]|uniref:hypothetical protein n=1 Tax=Streptomyces sp. DH8 TaxID=2857008 RepID=UPI001E4B4266|nr:hypothetical protein [Streptomyces sp. DH8]
MTRSAALARIDPAFAAHASPTAIRAQYEHAERMAELWSDRARELLLLTTRTRAPEDTQ